MTNFTLFSVTYLKNVVYSKVLMFQFNEITKKKSIGVPKKFRCAAALSWCEMN